jgi:hypothetical protein
VYRGTQFENHCTNLIATALGLKYEIREFFDSTVPQNLENGSLCAAFRKSLRSTALNEDEYLRIDRSNFNDILG